MSRQNNKKADSVLKSYLRRMTGAGGFLRFGRPNIPNKVIGGTKFSAITHIGSIERRLARIVFCVLAVIALGGQTEIGQPPYIEGDVIVGFHEFATDGQIATLEAANGLVRVRSFPHIRAVHYRITSGLSTSEVVSTLTRDPIVEYAEPNFLMKRNAVPTDPKFGEQWYLSNGGQVVNGIASTSGIDISWIAADALFTGSTEIIVAVVDSGVAVDHPEFIGRTWFNTRESFNGIDDDGNGRIDDSFGWDFYDPDRLPLDENSHGTLVAGLIAGVRDNGAGGAGISQRVKIMPLRVGNDLGSVDMSSAISAFSYAAVKGAKIINASFGTTGYSSAMYSTIQWLATRGVLLVAAAGNGGPDARGDNNDILPYYPASYALDNVISVAAIDQEAKLATFSNFGPSTVHIAAPGTNIFGASPTFSNVFFDSFGTGGTGWLQGHLPDSSTTYSWDIYLDSYGRNWITDSVSLGVAVNYTSFTNSFAMTPLIQTGFATLLTYRIWHQLEYLYDWLIVEASSDGGATWTPIDWVTGFSYSSCPSCSLLAGTIRRVDISPYGLQNKTVYFRFRLISDGIVNYDGVYLDEITLQRVVPFSYDGTQYQYKSGTSFAAPIVTGVAALIWSQRPDFTYKQVRSALLSTARQLPDLSGKVVTNGMVDAHAALQSTISTSSALTLSSDYVMFDARPVGTQSEPQIVTLGNGGTSSLSSISFTITTSSGFSGSENCPTTLSPGQTCQITFFSTPPSIGEQSGILQIYSDAPGSPHVIRLLGQGVVDAQAPSTPTSLAASAVSSSQIDLSWTPASDNGAVTQYKIYRGGSLLTTLSGNPPAVSFSDVGLIPATLYVYTVQACDAAGNCSAQSTSASATTQALATYGLTVTNLGGGVVTSSPAGISCGTNCAASFAQGTVVTLTANPNVGFGFIGWSGTCTGTGQCVVTVDAPNSVTAAFVDIQPPLVPAGLTANAASASQIDLTWTTPTDNISVAAYRLYRGGALLVTVNAPITGYSDTGLAASTQYTYTVQACDAAGNCSAQSTSASATTYALPDTQAPSIPSGVTATAVSSSQIDLSWTTSTDNFGVTTYQVYRGSTRIATVSASTTHHSDTGLAASTSYNYTISACDAAGNCSTQSMVASATTQVLPDTIAPSVPTGLTASALSSSQINLSWTASSDNVGVNSYKIYRGGVLLTAQGDVTNYSDTNLSPTTAYSYAVVACDAAGNCSAQSTSASATTQAPPDTTAPSVPVGLVASTVSASQINLSWSASTDNVGVTAYKVYRGGVLLVTMGPVTTYNDTSLAPSTSYSYTVQACDAAANCSMQSEAASATTEAAPDTTAPTVPGSFTATPVSSTRIDLAWTASTDAIGVVAYQVFRGGVQVGTTIAATLNFSDTGLTASTPYSYGVRACDAAGNCSAQATTSATTQGVPDTTAPSVPTGLTATAVSTSQINLSWTASTDNVAVTAYTLYRGGVYRATVTGATSFSDTGLTNGTPYTYTVAACDAAGNCSAQSASATATPGASSFTANLETGFNMIGNALNITLDVASLFGNQNAPTGLTSNVVSVWKWNAEAGRWAFYSPQLTVAGIASFAGSKGYEVLTTIAPGEGYWVNATGAITLPTQSGGPFRWNSFNFVTLPSGFNLISHASAVTPSQFNNTVSAVPPSPGSIATDNFASLWVWDAVAGTWYFYSPLLEATGGLAAVKSYADSHGFRHFQDYNKMLDIGVGFWVNRP